MQITKTALLMFAILISPLFGQINPPTDQTGAYSASLIMAGDANFNVRKMITSVRLSAVSELVGFVFSSLSNQYSLVAI